MKLFCTLVLLLLTFVLYAQNIDGKVVDLSSGQPLVYVNIGIINTSKGTITDENGDFNLDVGGLFLNSKVRFSVIGYHSQTFTIEELLGRNNIIELKVKPFHLAEVIISPKGKLKKIGTEGSSMGEVCGWGGMQFGQGNEVGISLGLGHSMVSLQSLHIKLYKQSFDNSLFRLHIRDIADGLPSDELLNKEVFISVTKKSGWIDIDLSLYHLKFKGDIALSLEWIKVDGLNKDRLIRVNRNKKATANVLFHIKRKQGTMFTRWGSENQWKRIENKSPTFYLTVQEL
ncbi:MAG: carboxypeptidase-like regulatory domain-containing protein [Bacteroidales bacterium]